MEGIKVILIPSQDTDYQSFRFDELGVTYFEWTKMSEDDKRMLVLENIMENIFSLVDSMEEY
ncbi:MAG TPA: hypothetical protein VKP88_07975 [Candidatus Paceibacterota bacterium]|nr:hypothetical protein [Candidatus Paceibacterota bacterium]